MSIAIFNCSATTMMTPGFSALRSVAESSLIRSSVVVVNSAIQCHEAYENESQNHNTDNAVVEVSVKGIPQQTAVRAA